MTTAQISIVASSAVAIASLLVNLIQAVGQRRHDAKQGFEARTFDRKIDAYLDLISVADSIERQAHTPSRLALDVWEDYKHLADVRPVVLAYGSDDCKKAVAELTTLYEGFIKEVSPWEQESLVRLRREKEELISEQDFEGASKKRDAEKTLLKRLDEDFKYDKDALIKLAKHTVEVTAATIKAT
ncbi:hypothetical protein ASE12_00200 [Aeromicrobium sp. Root236]|uniref:UvrB/UvrC motif-containing protein n=1 Tax=Aeromicrobium sp. Root236 TaxID=1736498 RepID=UPI0006FE52ED|nr:UvrB/UvrC motif-containing protein [Aeromicrobium sp. Root236]KRC63315.1 hypothetical protein ASE12_00200 [Aeromicrobium sp. Root236]